MRISLQNLAFYFLFSLAFISTASASQALHCDDLLLSINQIETDMMNPDMGYTVLRTSSWFDKTRVRDLYEKMPKGISYQRTSDGVVTAYENAVNLDVPNFVPDKTQMAQLVAHFEGSAKRVKEAGPAPEDAFETFENYISTLTTLLQKALPREGLRLEYVQLRTVGAHQYVPTTGSTEGMHRDGGCVTVTVSLIGEGTLYRNSKGQVRKTPLLETLLITATDRTQATGIPATQHASPRAKRQNRFLLLARYSCDETR